MTENEGPKLVEEPKQIEPQKILPICSHCGADPLLPIVRQINLPFKANAPPAMFLLLYCSACRKLIPVSDVVFLGLPESPIADPRRLS